MAEQQGQDLEAQLSAVRQNVQRDVEAAHDEKEYLQGYVEFSNFVASDHSLSIYKQFAVLGARNLLYLQAELQYMELKLSRFDNSEKRRMIELGDIEKQTLLDSATKSWEDMEEQAQQGDSKQTERLKLIRETRGLLDLYETALLRRDKVLKLEKPKDGPLKAFTAWFETKQPLWGSGHSLLDEEFEDDLVTLGNQFRPDRISSLMHRCLGYRLRKNRETPKSWDGLMYYYRTETITTIVGVLGVIASAALLVGAIVTLYFVKPMKIRLGIVGAFVLLFAGSLTLFTNTRQIEVYGATAAYAAVLVVFISVQS